MSAGWMASGRAGAPVSEIRLKIGGHELGVVRTFHARRTLRRITAGRDLLRSGWQTLVELPDLAPGEVELTAVGANPEGVSDAIVRRRCVSVR